MARYDFPILHIGDENIRLNKPFADIFGGRYVSYRMSAELLILNPHEVQRQGSYSVFSDGSGGKVSRIPSPLLTAKLKPGDFRVYRAGNAFAIRRNERLNEEAG